MNKLEKLIKLCKAAIYITVNDHKSCYESIVQNIYHCDLNPDELSADMLEEFDVDIDVLKKMVELDTMITIQAYPDTPIGFYKIYHYDMDKALDEALDCIEIKEN